MQNIVIPFFYVKRVWDWMREKGWAQADGYGIVRGARNAAYSLTALLKGSGTGTMLRV